MIKELLYNTRSVRRYDSSRKISYEELRDIAEATRLCPSTANLQRLRLALVTEGEVEQGIFDTLSFAALLRPWQGPGEGERPVGYIVIMANTEADVNLCIDAGIIAEAMLLVARERGIGGCMFRSFNREKLTRVLGKDGFYPLLVISLGYPGESVVLEDAKDGCLAYYRDEADVHHVPKLTLDELII